MTTLPRADGALRRIPLLLAALALPLVLLVPAAAAIELVHFTSPSKNIDCMGHKDRQWSVSCLAQNTSWASYPRRPSGCDVDWIGSEIGLGTRRVSLGSCRGDIGPLCLAGDGAACRTLKYGRSIDLGPIRCTSRTNGITCRYVSGVRAGFRIAREGYVIWRR
jgi:hypothetical protein